MSIYASLGGAGSIAEAVDRFYERVTADPDLAPFFDDVNMARLKAHQRAFFTAALGGIDEYKGRNMRAAHSGLGITDADFDRVVEHLLATLAELGVDQDSIGQVGKSLAPLKPEITES